jgi:hypothetical protein
MSAEQMITRLAEVDSRKMSFELALLVRHPHESGKTAIIAQVTLKPSEIGFVKERLIEKIKQERLDALADVEKRFNAILEPLIQRNSHDD